MDGREPQRQFQISRVLVREIFSLICRTMGLRPDFEVRGADFGENPVAPFVRIAESIMAIQIMLRDFLKRLFTSRSREIASDLTAATHDIINTIDRLWDGYDADQVYTMSAVLIELYLYCDAMGLSVPGEFFTDMFFSTNLAESFSFHIVLIEGEFREENPFATSFWQDYRVLADYIFEMTAPYQSVNVPSIPRVRQSYNMLVRSMIGIFGCPPTFSIPDYSLVYTEDIQEAEEEGAEVAALFANLNIEDDLEVAEGYQEAPLFGAEGGSVDSRSSLPPSTETESRSRTTRREDPSLRRSQRRRRIEDSYSVKKDRRTDSPSVGTDVPSTSSGHSEVTHFKGDSSVRPKERHRSVLVPENRRGDSSVRPKERHRSALVPDDRRGDSSVRPKERHHSIRVAEDRKGDSSVKPKEGDRIVPVPVHEHHTSAEKANRPPTVKDDRRRVTFGGTSVILIDSCRRSPKCPSTRTEDLCSGVTASEDLPIVTDDNLPGVIPTEGLATRLFDHLRSVAASESPSTGTEDPNCGDTTSESLPTRTEKLRSGVIVSEGLPIRTDDTLPGMIPTEGLPTRIYDHLRSVAASERLSTGTEDSNRGVTTSEGLPTRTDLHSGATVPEDHSTTESEHPTITAEEDDDDSSNEK